MKPTENGTLCISKILGCLFVLGGCLAVRAEDGAEQAKDADKDGLRIDLELATSVNSGYLCRGQTICDGWMNEQEIDLGNIWYGETYIPLYAGYWGMMHLEPTPEEDYSAGKWSEIDYWLGADVGRYVDRKLLLSANVLVCGLPEVGTYDAMTAVNVDVGYACWLNPRFHVRNRVLKGQKGKFELSFACSHRWELPKDFWTSVSETCWAVDYRNVDAKTPASGFTSLVTRGTVGWKMFFIALDVVAQLDPAALPFRRGQYYRPVFFSCGVRYVF